MTLAAAAVGLVVLLVVDSTQTTTEGYSSTPRAAASSPAPSSAPTSAPPSTTSPIPVPSSPTVKLRTAVYTGHTAGREAALAIAVKDGRAAAYVCDGQRLEAWLTGTATDDHLALRARTGERLVGTITDDRVTGTITLRGTPLRFTVRKAGPPAGLYRARTTTTVIGWIVLPDGSQVGVADDGSPSPAPRLDPDNGLATVDGVPVAAQPITGDETF